MTSRPPRGKSSDGRVRAYFPSPPRTRSPQPRTPTSKTSSGSAAEESRGSRRRALAAAFALLAAGRAREAIAAPPGCNIDPPAPVDVAAVLDQARGLYGTGRLEEAEAALVTAISLVSGCVARRRLRAALAGARGGGVGRAAAEASRGRPRGRVPVRRRRRGVRRRDRGGRRVGGRRAVRSRQRVRGPGARGFARRRRRRRRRAVRRGGPRLHRVPRIA